MVRNYIFDLDELSKVLDIKTDEFKINDNIELDTKNYYKNFSGETPKNWINSKNELYWYLKLRFISSKSIEQYFEQIKLKKDKWRPYWPSNLDS
ncbi:hypothetical protein E1I18_00695 [Mycoplasmopsis mucosicanis]|uniref:Uncharacterized protein n=1 Tax=Mycoplasmopsis mucosicanis TaxID=458208 RepID=A0A507SYA0_9BACT|nr:hypothetical protein [Mycoplasmopsis mucosicanis]TQC54108.1 hypothetical protein E1I18_00695 [Mycoplasmopsis mucosicanis]